MGDYYFQQNNSDGVDYSNPTVEQQSFAMPMEEQTHKGHTKIDEMLLGVSRDELPRIRLNSADMVSRQYLSHIREAIVTIRPDGIQFNNSCILKMPDTTHIQIFIDRTNKYLIIKACDEYDKDGQRWCNIKKDRRQSRKITGRPFCEKVYRMMTWSKGYYYKICGVPALQAEDEDELLFVFELKEWERYALTAKSRKAAGVEDEELSEEELRKLAEEELSKNKAKKQGKFPPSWDSESFGPSAADHVNRVMIPRVNELEMMTMEDSAAGDEPMSEEDGINT